MRIEYSSNYRLKGSATDKLISLIENIGADACIFGEGGGLACHEISLIERSGATLFLQDFSSNYPVYSQIHTGFLSDLSIIDAMFNIGASETKKVTFDAWHINMRAVWD